MTFLEFLNRCHITDTPRGDFIGDTRVVLEGGREQMPTALNEMLSIIRQRGIASGRYNPEAIRQARIVWRQYERARAKAGAA